MATYEQTIGKSVGLYPFQASPPAARPGPDLPPLRGARSRRGASGRTETRGIDIVVHGLLQAGDHEGAWRDLAGRSLERNPFYEPEFALAAARHLREAPRPAFLFAWDLSVERSAPGALLGVFPIAMPTLGLGTLELFGWRHEQCVLGTPLLDRTRAEEVMEQFFVWLSDATPLAGGIMLPMLPENGPTAQLIRRVVERSGRQIRRFGVHDRAVLRGGEEADALLARAMPARRLKEQRRLRRRLEERGALGYVSATTPQEVREAAEIFMKIEEAGWKGEAGGAFLHTAAGASFLRAATRSLAARGLCRIDILTVDGQPIAAGIVLGGGGRALYWKTAFDESLAALSPGVQFTLELTRRQLADGGPALTDSCAMPDHPMINRLWPDREAIADWFIPARVASSAASLVVARETATRSLRGHAKALYHRLKA